METRLLPVEKGEGRVVGPLAALFFCLAFAYQIGQTAAYALFIERFGRGSLPWAFLVMPVVGSLLTLVNTTLVSRVPLRRLLTVELVVLVAVASAIRVGVGQGLAFVLFLLPAWDAATNSLNNMIVWTTSGRLLDVRQAKRLGGVIISGRSAGLVVAGLAVHPIVGLIGTANLYLVEIGALVVGGGLLAAIIRANRVKLAAKPRDREIQANAVEAEKLLRNRSFTRAVLLLILLTMIAYVLVRNILLDRAAVEFPTSESYASTIGLVSAAHGLATLLASLFFAGRFMSRFGIRGALIAFPTGLLAVYLPFVALGYGGGSNYSLFIVAAIGYSLGGVLMYGLRTPALQVLYQLIQPSKRDRIRAAADGIVEPSAIGIAALVMLFATRVVHANATGIAIGLLILAVVLLATVPNLARRYRTSLKDVVRGHLYSGGTVDLNDPAAIEDIANIIESDDAESIVALLGLLDEETSASIAPKLLHHTDPDVRQYALDRLRGSDSAAVESIARNDPDPSVRAAAVSLLGDSTPPELALTAVNDSSYKVRAAVLPHLLRAAPNSQLRNAGDHAFVALATSPDVDERKAAARLLEQCPVSADLTQRLASDADPGVRDIVLTAQCRVGNTEAIKTIVRALASASASDRQPIRARVAPGSGASGSGAADPPNLRTTSARKPTMGFGDAIVAAGDAAIGPLVEELASPTLEPAGRSQLIRCLRKIGSSRAHAALATCAASAEPTVRRDALVAFELSNGVFSPSEKVQRIDRELTAALDDLRWCEALNRTENTPDSPGFLAEQFFRERIAATRDRALLIAGCGAHRNTFRRLRVMLESAHPQLAYAVELLEVSTDTEVRRRLLPLVIGSADDPAAMISMVQAASSAAVAASKPSASLVASAGAGADRIGRDALAHIVSQHRSNSEVSMSVLERLIVLKKVEMFARLSPNLLVDVANLLEELRCPAGQELFAEGDPGSDMYVIVDGFMRVETDGRIVDRPGPLGVLGELALLDGEARSASVVAETDTLLYRLSAELFFELMLEHPDVMRSILHTVVLRLRARMHDVAQLREQLQARGEANQPA